MLERIRRMKPRHLAMSWVTYWIGLGVTTLWKPVSILWRVSRPDAKGSFSLSYGDGAIKLSISQANAVDWIASADVSTILFWIAVPPLVLWGVWFLLRGRDRALATPDPFAALAPGDGPMDPIQQHREPAPVHRTPV